MARNRLLLSLVIIIILSLGGLYFFEIRPAQLLEQEAQDAIKLQVLNEVQKIKNLYPTIKLQEDNWSSYSLSISRSMSSGGPTYNLFSTSNTTKFDSVIETYNGLKIDKSISYDSENIWIDLPYPPSIFKWSPVAKP